MPTVTCQKSGPPLLRLCKITAEGDDQIEGEDCLYGFTIVVRFKQNAVSYCWGAHLGTRYTFYFHPNDQETIVGVLNNGGSVWLHWGSQPSAYKLDDCHWYL